MPITVQYGPITAALRLAQQAGEGEAQRFERSHPRQFIDLTARRREEEFKDKQLEMANALAYDQIASKERLAQQELKQRSLSFEADQRYRADQQALAQQREGRAQQGATRNEEVRKQFQDRFGMSPEEFNASLSQSRVDLSQQRQAASTQRRASQDELKKFDELLQTKRENFKMWEKAVKQYSSMDNIISGEYTPEGAMKVAASRDRAREEVEQAATPAHEGARHAPEDRDVVRASIEVPERREEVDHRVELGEIESALLSLDSVKEAAAVANQDGEGASDIRAAVVVGAGQSKDLETPQIDLRGKLPSHSIPSEIAILEALPRTPTGKIDRARLIEKLFPAKGPNDE